MPEPHELEAEAEQLRADGKFEDAIAKLNEILEMDPKHVRAHLALAVTHQKTGEFLKSVEHGVKATEIEPEDPFNFTALSVTYQRAFVGTNDPKYIQLAEEAKYKADRMMHG